MPFFRDRRSRTARRGGGGAATVAAQVDVLEPRLLLSATNDDGEAAYGSYGVQIGVANDAYLDDIDAAIARFESGSRGVGRRASDAVEAAVQEYTATMVGAAGTLAAAARSATAQYDAALDGADRALESAVETAALLHADELEKADDEFTDAVTAATKALGSASAAATVKHAEAGRAADLAYVGAVGAADLAFLAASIEAAETYEAAAAEASAAYDEAVSEIETTYAAALESAGDAAGAALGNANAARDAAIAEAEAERDAAGSSGGGGDDYESQMSSGADAEEQAQAAYEDAVAAAEAEWAEAYGEAMGAYAEAVAAADAERETALAAAAKTRDDAVAAALAAKLREIDAAEEEWGPAEREASAAWSAATDAAFETYAGVFEAASIAWGEAVGAAEEAWDAADEAANEKFTEAYGEASWAWALTEMSASFDFMLAEFRAFETYRAEETAAENQYASRLGEAGDKWRADLDELAADLWDYLADADADWAAAEQRAYEANRSAFDGESGRSRATPPTGAEQRAADAIAASRAAVPFTGSPHRENFLKTLDDDVRQFLDNKRWPAHHRYQQAIGPLLEKIDGNIRMHGAENIRFVPYWVHYKINGEQNEFMKGVIESINDHFEKPGNFDPNWSPLDPKQSGWDDILQHHPDLDQLADDYKGLVDYLDDKFKPYWLDPGAGWEDIDRLAKNLGTRRGGIFADATKDAMEAKLANRNRLHVFMSQRKIGVGGVLAMFSFVEVADGGRKFVDAANSQEMARLMYAYQGALDREAEGKPMRKQDIMGLADTFDAYLLESGVKPEIRNVIYLKFVALANAAPGQGA